MSYSILNHPLVKRIKHEASRKGVDVYLVGGCVRDILLGIDNVDFDFTMEEDPLLIIEGSPFEVVQHFKKFMTFKLKYGETVFDLARTRKEVYPYPGSLPVVSPGSLEDDARRRDYSINSIYISVKDGSIYDPFNSREDIDRRILRVLHDKSFEDDPTRILRGVRLKHRLGFEFDDRTYRLIEKAISGGFMYKVSGDRIYNELHLLSRETKRKDMLEELEGMGILKIEDRRFMSKRLTPEEYLLSILAFTDVIQRYSPHIKTEYEDVIRTLVEWRKIRDSLKRTTKKSEIYMICSRFNEKGLSIIGKIDRTCKGMVELYINELKDFKIELTGDDLKSYGVDGKNIGRLLQKIRMAKMDGKVLDEREYLEKLIKEGNAW